MRSWNRTVGYCSPRTTIDRRDVTCIETHICATDIGLRPHTIVVVPPHLSITQLGITMTSYHRTLGLTRGSPLVTSVTGYAYIHKYASRLRCHWGASPLSTPHAHIHIHIKHNRHVKKALHIVFFIAIIDHKLIFTFCIQMCNYFLR